MPSLEDEMNIALKPLCEAVKNGYKPFEYIGLTEGMTNWDSSQMDAVSLNPPIAGIVRDLSREPGIEHQAAGNRFILRTLFGYAAALRLTHEPGAFLLQSASLLNALTGAAYKVYGSRIISLSFDRPGPIPNTYFRELENFACYEIRLYGELHPVLTTEVVNE